MDILATWLMIMAASVQDFVDRICLLPQGHANEWHTDGWRYGTTRTSGAITPPCSRCSTG